MAQWVLGLGCYSKVDFQVRPQMSGLLEGGINHEGTTHPFWMFLLLWW